MILIINGSPRNNGNVARMLKEMKLTAEQSGAEVELINISELNVKPCIGCMKCRTALKCCLPADDSVDVMQLIRRA
ncbi:MAG: flavodoxin family protein, partial [Prevotella sp.]